MGLKLEHLAPYSPYDLELIFEKSGRKIKMKSCFNDPNLHILDKLEYNVYDTSIWNFKPLLQPLSKFDEKEFQKLNEFIGFNWCDAYDEYFKVWFNDSANIDKLVLQAPYEIFQYFLSEHYDVFDLIKNGLATIKE